MNWFNGGDALTLERVMRKSTIDVGSLVSVHIVKALLRVNPFELFGWLARGKSTVARSVLVGLTSHRHVVDEGDTMFWTMPPTNHCCTRDFGL
ncbi:hypothetical protein A6U92_23005 [Agrobacterium rubi]|nr:hypothetical protein A6U92_23005 [Agrobacterium rubi]